MSDFIVQNKLTLAVFLFFVLLCLAQAGVWAVCRHTPEKDWTELRLRMRTWWIIVLVFVAIVCAPKIPSLILFAMISFLALKEYFTIIPTRFSDNAPLICAYLSIPVQYYWVGIEWFNLFIIFVPIYIFLLIPTVMIVVGDTQGFLRSAASIHWGVMTTVFAISHIAYLNVLEHDRNTGALMVIFLVALTECNDIAQYIWGKNFGKRKIIPKVSPNKTVEGLSGGIGTSIILSIVLAPMLTPISFSGTGFLHSIAIGVLIGVFGFIGDVVMSAVKRDIGIKDTGTLLPGHGGILDRLDSLIFTAPVFFHFMAYFYY